jgi:Protein of unknown function (DUF2950)
MTLHLDSVSAAIALSGATARRQRSGRRFATARLALCALVFFATAPPAGAAGSTQETFATPDAGVAALAAAVKANDQAALRAILGAHGEKLIHSGDPVADAKGRAAFVAAYEHSHKIEMKGDAQAAVVIGNDQWPLPIPLAKGANGWYFDTQKGEREILDRRIGRNELSTIQACLAIVDAERDYVAKDQDANGVLEYARQFVSTPGKHDGLYWVTKPGEPSSPLGPLLAAAAKGGYGSANPLTSAPYHGYYYRILTQQGKNAPGGAYDYLVRGKLIGGFAVIAYPARYGVSGIMTFLVNYDGVVYQKDLGKNTATIAAAMVSFNPDASWKRP